MTGQAHNTVFVFSSDNGYHLGEYRLRSGKQTAFDTDIRVPLVVAGPGIPADTVNTDMAENIDLRPTFEQLGGATTPPGVEGPQPRPAAARAHVPWRTYALIEHHYDPRQYADPDKQDIFKSPVPPTYNAIRTRNFVYVRYIDGEREYYNLLKDPYELHNLGPSLPPAAPRRPRQDHEHARSRVTADRSAGLRACRTPADPARPAAACEDDVVDASSLIDRLEQHGTSPRRRRRARRPGSCRAHLPRLGRARPARAHRHGAPLGDRPRTRRARRVGRRS